MRRAAALFAAATTSALVLAQGSSPPAVGKPMTISSRILLNRLAVTGRRSVAVMLALDDDAAFDRVSSLVGRLHGHVMRSERAIAYVRAEVPLESLIALIDAPGVTAYQISSQSRGAWYRDGPPQANAEMYREYEVSAVGRPAAAPPGRIDLPPLSPEAAHAPGYTGDDVGIGSWLSAHPTFDGRGVTIAILESGEPEFLHPALSTAKSLDGRDVPKIGGILDGIDPDEPDPARVDLETEIEARGGTWCRVGNRTYIVPRPGNYRLGFLTLPAGDNLAHTFAVLEDNATGELRIDANGNADFRDDPPLADVNTSFEPRTLRLLYPRKTEIAFVIARDRVPHRLRVYTARSGHMTMTVSVAAGARTADGLGFGVAPAARVLLVRNQTEDLALHDFFEGYLEAAKRTDVDILDDSTGVTLVPDTSADFGGIFFHRLIAVYRKPIFHAAGNSFLFLGNVSSFGDVFSVGGTMSRANFAALYGGGDIGETIVHPLSIGGPAADGAFKPDFVAPMPRIAADVFIHGATTPLPKNAPSSLLPQGYVVSCCTSASSPFAAGVAALLISAAKQTSLPYTVESLGRALRAGARFLPSAPAHDQGAGLIDVQATWRELQRVDAPRIRVAGPLVHALTPYAAHGAAGVGLFERGGWAAGERGTRVLSFTRESGPAQPIVYTFGWTGNDGTFSVPPSVALSLNETVAVAVNISVATPGAHSAILNLRDPTGAIVLRTMPTIVAPVQLDDNRSARLAGVVPLMRSVAHYVSVPNGIGAIAVELEVTRGSLGVMVVPSHGMVREYYGHVTPQAGRTFTKGRYSLVLPTPAAGVWSITLENLSAWREPDPALVSTGAAEYAVSVRLLSASLHVLRSSNGSARVEAANDGSLLRTTAIDVAAGTERTLSAETAADGLPNRFEIDVPAGASSLALHVRGATERSTLELHLYDCTTGECFSYDFTVPAAREQSMVVRHPNPGRWVAAVNSAPLPSASVPFVIDELIAGPAHRHDSAAGEPRPTGARWTETIPVPHDAWTEAGASPVVILELIDTATEEDDRAHPWENRVPDLTNFAERPAAIARAVLPIK